MDQCHPDEAAAITEFRVSQAATLRTLRQFGGFFARYTGDKLSPEHCVPSDRTVDAQLLHGVCAINSEELQNT